MADQPIRPDGFEIRTATDRSHVRLRFYQDGLEDTAVLLTMAQLPSLISELTSKIPPGSGAPIDLASLRPGKLIQVSTWKVTQAPGGLRLLLGVDLSGESPPRYVEIPLTLPPQEALGLISEIAKSLAKPS